MDAILYIKEINRMCESFEMCIGCPFSTVEDSCDTYTIEHPEKVVELLEVWIKENPRKTIFNDFLEKYPKITLNCDGTPNSICPSDLGFKGLKDCKDCVKCWNQEMTK